jgi:PAS domain-containing protein/anti-sigma regulatory factor (Ser/Thr protein kinase)
VDTDPDPEPGTVLDSLKVAVVMLDTTGRILLWSPLAEEMLGWAGEHIVGRRVSALMAPAEPPEPPDPSGTAEPSGAARGRRRMTEVPLPGPAERILAELLRHGRWSGLLSLRHRDGHIVQAEARASLLVDGEGRPFVLASVAESSRLRILEHDLAALDALFGSSPLGVAIFDTDLRYVRVNEALARMNKLAAADHAGRRVEEIVQGPAAERLAKLQRDVLDTGVPAIDVLLPPRPGAPGAPGDAGEMIGWRSASYHRLEDRAGHVLGISCTVMDVSERQTALAKIERARQRLALINDVGARIADLLDVHLIAKTLAQTVVPAFSDFSGVILHSAVAEGGELHRGQAGEITEMRQLGIGAVRAGPDVERMISIGRIVQVTRESVFGTVLRTGRPQLIGTAEELRATTHPDDPSVEAALELGVHSLIVVPLRARGIVLGLFVITRVGEREPFDQDDLALANELADRAGASLDNARLYVREREGALMLQRGLLPQHVPHPPGVRIAHRYVPAGSGAEAGGDWFDVIPLAGGRVALVVGDVMGHGLRAAATMGRLRTAVRTLAGLDMPPEELLRRVDDLGEDLAQRPGEGWMATCVYAVYDPSTRRLAVASAGHFPPVLVGPEGTRQLDVPPGVPLGVGGVEFESVEADVPDGSVLVLYTDGLVESRGEDITEGMQRLRTVLRRPVPSLEEACDELLAVMRRGGEPDDVALLMARLGGLPEGSTVGWTFRAEPSAVRQARRCIREALRAWRLDALADTTVLLVSELVTNSLRYAHGPIGVRMVRGTSLLVEVSDPLPDPPRERTAHEEDEGGRGLQLVARASRRWGTRHGPLGKTVWFELALP